MKSFDLDAAKRGAAVCTRSGYPARIICWDMKWKPGNMGDRIVYLADYNGNEHLSHCLINGAYHGEIRDGLDLMMRDDDYLEKLERGEYAPSVKENLTVENPTCKESLPVDREYWRRVYAGQAMQGLLADMSIELLPADAARFAVCYTDALIEKLERTSHDCSKGSQSSEEITK